MSSSAANPKLFAVIPSLDRLLREPAVAALVEQYGRATVTGALRVELDTARARIADIGAGGVVDPETLQPTVMAARVADTLARSQAPSLKPVFNLTGTVLHTNLGRAPLAEEAIAAMATVARGASNLEFDLDRGRRGERDSHVAGILRELTGAEAAIVVNNNAAAVTLVLNTLANRREAIVSRGELIEIGGAFRMPDIMARAGAKLVEVGTTNRTHGRDYGAAISSRSGLIMKVHTSNYRIEGFTASVDEAALSKIAHDAGLPFVVDLGAGSLIDLARYGLPHEPTVRETLEAGADLVTFSGDKLLGGPQAGLIAGRGDLIAKLAGNPLKRAMRADKLTIAALAATLNLYRDPDRLAQRLPALRLLTRPVAELQALAERIEPALASALASVLGDVAAVEICASTVEIGSGAMPVEVVDSVALVVRPQAKRGRGRLLARLAAAFRALPVPVIGFVRDDALWFDLRTLEDGDRFVAQLDRLDLAG